MIFVELIPFHHTHAENVNVFPSAFPVKSLARLK
jgi:hypothetical protein